MIGVIAPSERIAYIYDDGSGIEYIGKAKLTFTD